MEILKGSSKHGFKTIQNLSDNELSKHVWNLKDHGLDNNLPWEINKKASPSQCGTKHCNLCLLKKFPSFMLIQKLY